MGWSTLMRVSLVVTSAAFFFFVVGFVIPFWISVVHATKDANNKDIEIGGYFSMWWLMACIDGEGTSSCYSAAIKPNFGVQTYAISYTGNSPEDFVTNTSSVFANLVWSVLQVVVTVDVFFTALALLILICSRCSGGLSKAWFIVACILLFFSGLICFGIVALFSVIVAVIFTGPAFELNSAREFPWSVLFFGLGGLLSFVASIILMVITCSWERYAYAESDDGSDVPMTNMDKHGYPDYRQEYVHGHDNPKYYSGSGNHDKGYTTYPDYSRDYTSSRRENDYSSSRRDPPQVYDKPYSHPSKYSQSNMYRPYAAGSPNYSQY